MHVSQEPWATFHPEMISLSTPRQNLLQVAHTKA